MPQQPPATAVLRIVDAEANRAAEGLRVVEDYVRFVLDDRHLTEQTKRLRHDLTSALRSIAPLSRLASRESADDVGAEVSTPSETFRADASAVAAASLKRVQQALRALEEYLKLLDAAAAGAVEALRYRLYTLERAVVITADAVARLEQTRLYVLVDGRQSEAEFASLAETLIAAGVDAIQLRDKKLDDRQLLSRARRLRGLLDVQRESLNEERTHTQPPRPLFIMNDRPDLAVLSRADGVHVGQDELSVKDVRSIVGPNMLIGVSTHSIDQARQAVLDGANYIGVGPTFPSNTKSFKQFTGVELLAQVAAEIRLPAFAIGGITLENLPRVIEAGIHRVAVSGAVVDAADVSAAARSMRNLLSGSSLRTSLAPARETATRGS